MVLLVPNWHSKVILKAIKEVAGSMKKEDQKNCERNRRKQGFSYPGPLFCYFEAASSTSSFFSSEDTVFFLIDIHPRKEVT